MEESDQSAGLASSFTDLMTSLAVIFILLLVASLNNAFQKGENTRLNILDKLQNELREYIKKGIVVQQDKNDPLALLILVPEGLLEFQFNSAQIPEKGKEFLVEFIPKLSKVVYSEEFRKEIRSIVVEGHADSQGSDQLNLKLSQDRSMSVVGKCLDILEKKNMTEEKDYFLERLSATGRGKKEPIYSEEDPTKTDDAKSRRVVFKIRISEQKLENLTLGVK